MKYTLIKYGESIYCQKCGRQLKEGEKFYNKEFEKTVRYGSSKSDRTEVINYIKVCKECNS